MTINIRDIQHYMYCPRRFWLLAVNRDWAENVFVVKANIMHENVHSGEHALRSGRKIEMSAVAVYNDELDIYGITDCIEFEKSENGTYIDSLDGKYNVKLVEYKPKQPKNGEIRETDAIQVFAQKLCADYIWSCNSYGYIYYADTKKRIKLPFNEEYDKYFSRFTELIAGMKECAAGNEIPGRIKGQRCSGCSMKDLCMPQEKRYRVKDEVLKEDI